MFKKLRNKFLILNMVMVSVLLIGAFCVVFMMVYRDTNKNIEMQLDRGLSFFQPGNRRGFNPDRGALPDFEGSVGEVPENDRRDPVGQEMNEVSAIMINESGEIAETHSFYDYSEDFYNSIIGSALSEFKAVNDPMARVSGTVKLDGVYYKYLIVTNFEKPGENGGADSYVISISNINTRTDMLRSLVLTLSVVLVAALIFLLMICMFFANRSIKPIKEAWDKQKQFIADASHELKTPLTVINTNADVLLIHRDNTIEQEKKWIYYIKDEAARMTKLTNDLLYLAKVDYGAENNTVKSVVSLSSAAESVILTMEAVVFEKNLFLTDSIEENVYVKGDLGQLKQLIMILLDNAVKYTNEGGSVEVTLSRSEGKARLSVKNTGEGIKAEDAAKIFDRFYRSDKSRSRQSGGYGLGLAIAKTIAVSHKGDIKLKSEPDKFTEFIVELPAAHKPKG